MAGGEGRELDRTPTWAVSAVCVVIIAISIALEKALHRLGHWFTEKRKMALFEALEKIKTELMILGFISLLLVFGQDYIAKICMPEKFADSMLPCNHIKERNTKNATTEEHKRFVWHESSIYPSSSRHLLAAAASSSCPDGNVPLISTNGMHQLHIFMFFLAVFHVIYSAVTMALGRAKIRRWKHWEKETQSPEYGFSIDPSRFRFAHETSFVRRHSSIWNKTKIMFYIVSFFRQFFRSVDKADYLALRHGFITAHLARDNKFNFRRYIKRSLEDDFKVVVSISWILWFSVVILLLLNVKGWHTLLWASLLPLFILLAVGTKLQAIISKMALEIKERNVIIQGIPVVTLSDQHFWFQRPELVLFLIHFTLFLNAFQIIYVLWILYSFGLHSCFHENSNLTIARIGLGVGVQVLCSYVTLPLYALVSQMGSNMKRTIFDEQIAEALKKWHQTVKNRRKKSTPSITPGTSPTNSPAYLLHRYKTIGHSTSAMALSRRKSYSDKEASDTEIEMIPPSALKNERDDPESGLIEQNADARDHFSFIKPSQSSG